MQLSAVLDVPPAEWRHPPPFRYHLVGVEADGDVHVGLMAGDGAPHHPDVVPADVHEAVVAAVSPAIDFDRLAALTAEADLPFLGTCTIDGHTGDELQAAIELVDDVLET